MYLAKWSSVKRNHKDIIRHAQIFLKKVIMLLFFRQKQKQKILIKTYVQKWIKNKKIISLFSILKIVARKIWKWSMQINYLKNKVLKKCLHDDLQCQINLLRGEM